MARHYLAQNFLFLLLSIVLVVPIMAAEEQIRVSGFLSAGSSYIDEREVTLNTTFEQFDEIDARLMDNVLGIQISANPYENLTATIQLVGKASQGDFNIEASWAFVHYQINSHYSTKIGKMRLPTFLASEYLEVGYAYPWVRPPMEMYLQVPMKQYNGIDLSRSQPVSWWPLYKDAALTIQLFTGAIPERKRVNTTIVGLDTSDTNNLRLITDSTEINFSGTNVIGANLEVANSKLVTRIGYAQMELTYEDIPAAATGMAIFDTQIQISNLLTALLIDAVTSGAASAYLASIDSDSTNLTTAELNTLLTQTFSISNSFSSQAVLNDDNFFGKFWSIGISSDNNGHVFISELGERKVILPSATSSSRTWYVTYGFRLGEFLPHITFAKSKVDNEIKLGSGISRDLIEQIANANSPVQESVTLGLRWDMNEYSAVKFDISQLRAEDSKTGLFVSPPEQDVHIVSMVLDLVF